MTIPISGIRAFLKSASILSEIFVCTKTHFTAVFISRMNVSELQFQCRRDVSNGTDRTFAPEHQNNHILHELFPQHLPQTMLSVLAAANDMPLGKLAELTDQVAEYIRSPIIATVTEHSSTLQSSSLPLLGSRIEELSRQVATLAPLSQRQAPRYRSRQSSHQRCRQRSRQHSRRRTRQRYHSRSVEH